MTATIRGVPRPRGELTGPQQKRLTRLTEARERAEAEYRSGIVTVLLAGASFSEVAKFTGLSTNTLQRWKREAMS